MGHLMICEGGLDRFDFLGYSHSDYSISGDSIGLNVVDVPTGDRLDSLTQEVACGRLC